jgi:glucosamine--fructose-6-phosphate aminotransferase (isomerizing)
MCGIIGIVGDFPKGTMGSHLREGLAKLEYRGYDSCGIAVANDGKLELRKEVGMVGDVSAAQDWGELDGEFGMAHCRWATTGAVTQENAHPHSDCDNDLVVVHNGIIENYLELKRGLAVTHEFRSDTDSEVAAHLIEDELAKGVTLEEAVRLAVKRMHGSYALLVGRSSEKKLIAVRNESPLIAAIGEGFAIAASDATPVLSHTRDLIFLDDGEIAVLTAGAVQVLKVSDGTAVDKKPTTVDWSAEQAQKGGYADFMLKEIMEQPLAVADALRQDDAAVQDFADDLMLARNVIIIAMGTARHAGLITRYALDSVAGKHAEVMMASEYTYFADRAGKDTIIFAISQSGETADVVVPAKKAKAKGAKIYSLVNVVGSTLDRMSDKRLYINAGPEIAVASTKAFVNQVVVGMLLSFAAAGRLAEGKQLLSQMPLLVKKCIDENDEKARELSKWLAKKHDAYYIARGINFATALEGALKIKEVSYLHAEGMPAGELKHGTIALIEKETPVIVINPSDITRSETLANAVETKARGAFVIGVSDEPDPAYDAFLRVPKASELFYPLLSVVPLQLLAYYTAKERGISPDKPRNLAKSVTVL